MPRGASTPLSIAAGGQPPGALAGQVHPSEIRYTLED
jgi:hypothetical protein